MMNQQMHRFLDIEAQISQLKMAHDTGGLKQLFSAFSEEQIPEQLQHWQIYYRAFILLTLSQLGADSKTHSQQATALLKDAHGIEDKSDEFYTLVACCSGHLAAATSEPLAKARAGMTSDKSFKISLEINPDNPRTYLLQGLSFMNKPRLVGGSKKKALMLLTKSVELFQSAPSATEKVPSWGHLDALYWLSHCHLYFNHFKEAGQYIDQALQIDASFNWGLSLKQKIELKSAS
jgi:tetratricopeptide (TPR) repeat protein